MQLSVNGGENKLNCLRTQEVCLRQKHGAAKDEVNRRQRISSSLQRIASKLQRSASQPPEHRSTRPPDESRDALTMSCRSPGAPTGFAGDFHLGATVVGRFPAGLLEPVTNAECFSYLDSWFQLGSRACPLKFLVPRFSTAFSSLNPPNGSD